VNENFKLMTVKEAAPRLGRSEQGLYRDIREGQFPFPAAVVRFGKQIRINLDAVVKATEQPSNAAQAA
jgi:excisionase family DNA binding protein